MTATPAAGQELALTLDLGTGPLSVHARVVRCDRITGSIPPWRLGLSFTDRAPELEAALAELLAARSNGSRAG